METDEHKRELRGEKCLGEGDEGTRARRGKKSWSKQETKGREI